VVARGWEDLVAERAEVKLTSERLGGAAVACLLGAYLVLTIRIYASTKEIHKALAQHRQDVETFAAAMKLGLAKAERKPDVVTDSCGCPGPYEVCRDACVSCVCRHMPDVWTPVDEARAACWKECE
jgi:hypothetical protein